jgi:hypothetical protein
MFNDLVDARNEIMKLDRPTCSDFITVNKNNLKPAVD